MTDSHTMLRTSRSRASSSDRVRFRPAGVLAVSAAALLVAGLGLSSAAPASAAEVTVGLGTADAFAVLAGSAVTNTGPSVISGDLGVAPDSAVTGFPPGLLVDGGTQHVADAVAIQAQNDLTTAYNDAAGRSVTQDVTDSDLGGMTLVSGVYADSSGMQLTGTVTLDGQGDPNAVFIFKAGSTLTTASNSTVALINGASACNVFWQVGSSATLGTGTDFVGTIMALTSATLNTGADVEGRVLARNGAVTLDTNNITAANCEAATTPTATPTESTPTESTPTESATDRPPNDQVPPGGGGGDGPGGPTVPVGHPETGLDPAAADRGARVLYGLGLFAILGACLAFGRAVRTSRTI